jgi:hypothetical protein
MAIRKKEQPMKLRIKRLPTPALVVACVALVASLGGVSYAAGVLPENSVGTAQLQKKAVSASKLKKNAVTGAKVKNGTLKAADFGAGQLPAGPQGPKGDPGPQGPKGDPGGFSGYEIVTDVDTLLSGGGLHVVATCPAGKKVLGGGYSSSSNLATERSHPINDGTAWDIFVNDPDNSSQGVAVYAICANVS